MIDGDLKLKAIELRKKGYSYNLIRGEIPVSKSTLSLWLRDVDFSPNKEVQNRVRGAVSGLQQWVNRNKQVSIETAKKQSRAILGGLSHRDLLMFGLGLYVGEGSKTAGIVRVVNSDPRIISLAVRWFEEVFGLQAKNFFLTIHLYPDNNQDVALNFWSKTTGIPRRQFGKTQVDRRDKKSKKKGLLHYGTAHLYVNSRGEKKFGVLLFRTILAMMEETFRQLD